MAGIFDKIPDTFILDEHRLLSGLPLAVWENGPLHARGVLQFCLEASGAPFQLARMAQPHHLVYVIREGEFMAGTVSGEVRAGPGQALIAPAGLQRQIALDAPAMRLFFFWIEDRPEWAFLHEGGLRTVDCLWGEQVESLFLAFRAEMLEQADPEMRDRYGEQILHLLERLRRPGQVTASDYRWRLRKLRAAISARPQAPWTLEDVAEGMHLSPAQCYRVVMELENRSPVALVRRLRMEQAAHLLRHSADTLDRIAEAVGYASAYSFSRAFQREFKMRPGAWRHGG